MHIRANVRNQVKSLRFLVARASKMLIRTSVECPQIRGLVRKIKMRIDCERNNNKTNSLLKV